MHLPELGADPKPPDWPLSVLVKIAQRDPNVVLVHHLYDASLAEGLLNSGYPVAVFVHAMVCSTGKLFRRTDRPCTHAVGRRCLWDWYAGPCGTSPSSSVAVQAHRRAVSYLAILRRLPVIFVASNFMKDYLVGEGVRAECIVVIDWFPEA